MKNKRLLMLAVLAPSLVLTSNTAIASGIPAIQAAFPTVSAIAVESLVTLPQAAVIAALLMNQLFIRHIGIKNTVLTGLSLAAFFGIAPVLLENFTLLLLSRFFYGFGLGLFNSLAISLIYAFFTDDLAKEMIGYQSAFQGIGAGALTYIAGKLLVGGWQPMFLIYLICWPILAFFLVNVPTPTTNVPAPQVSKRLSLSEIGSLLPYGLGVFSLSTLYMTFSLKTSQLLLETNSGTLSDAALALTLVQIANITAGLLFGRLSRQLGYRLPVMACLAFSFSLLLPGILPSFPSIIISAGLVGFAFSVLTPLLFSMVVTKAPNHLAANAMSLVLIMANLGNFFSPYLFELIGKLNLARTFSASVFIFNGLLMLSFTVCLSVFLVRSFRNGLKKTSR